MNHLRLIGLLLMLMLAASSARAQATFDRWYLMTLDGQRAGYSHTRVERDGDTYRTQVMMRLTIRRGTFVMDVTHTTTFVETLEGQPLEATLRTNMLNLAVHYTFGPESMTAQNLNTGHTQTLPPLPGQWLAPAAASRLVEQQMKQGAKQIAVRTIDITLGPKVVDLTMTIAGPQEVEVLGRVVSAVMWEARSSAAPGVSVREYVDQAGRPLKSRVQAGAGLVFEMIAADQALATADVDPPEIMAATLIQPNRRIHQPRQLRQAVYQVTIEPQPNVDLTLPTTAVQRVELMDATTFRITVDLDQPVARKLSDPPSYLQVTHVLDHDDAQVVALAKPFVDASQDPRATALAMRGFVHRYIDAKDLSVGFATASQVAVTQQGDCTEHAVLLAAMLRQAQIPSRVVSGLIYAEQFLGQRSVFGYHMWTQAWLPAPGTVPERRDGLGRASGETPGGGGWVDLDATLNQPFDATHIALKISAMDDQALANDLVGLVPLLGGLKIQVVQTGGRKGEMAPSLPN